MNTAEADQLAAVARDAGRAAKESMGYKALDPQIQAVIDGGVHMARDLIRGGLPREDAEDMLVRQRALFEGINATLEAFVADQKPMDDWS